MASKTLQFDYNLPWRLVERRAAAGDFENLCATFEQLRTYFQGISTGELCLKDIEKMAQKPTEENKSKN